jgi:hypothetical protein
MEQIATQSYLAPLAYLLEKSGFPVNRVYPTKGSNLEKTIKTKGQKWLREKNSLSSSPKRSLSRGIAPS